MGKKVQKSLSNEGSSCLKPTEKTITLDSTYDPDIIECSVVDESSQPVLKKVKCSFRRISDSQSPKTPVNGKELKNTCSSIKDSKGLREILRNSYGLSDDKVSPGTAMLQTPRSVRNTKESNSTLKKIISTLKKTPEGPYLSISKLRNVEKWLSENEVETVWTPPFANLSVTPRNSLKKRLSSRWKDENIKPEECSMDSDVEGVLKAVYGDNWQRKNIQSRAKTEPKKKSKRFLSPVSQTKNNYVVHSVRRNIMNDKKLSLSEKSESENNFDDSFVSGIRMINLDSSGCDDERVKTNFIKTVRKERNYEAEDSDFESWNPSPVRKKKQNGVQVVAGVESKRRTPKGSTSKGVTPKGSTCKGVTPKGSTSKGVTPKCSTRKKETPNPSTNKKCPTDAGFKTPKKTFLASLSVSTPTSRCHPDAQDYKINFKSKKEELVKKLYKLYNGEVFEWKLAEDMSFSWNVKLRGTAGYCYNKRVTKSTGEVIRQSRIEFSTKIVDRADRLRDTMIHELCHAASWVIDGVLDGHGEVWSKWASRAGRRFPELPAIKRCHNYDIVSKYVYKCTGCGYSIKRHSKSINTERKRCGHCYGVLELLINKKKKGKGEVPEFDTTRTLPTPNKFAMFVKENYHSVKSAESNAKHSEIMKILSEKYALLKNGPKSAKK